MLGRSIALGACIAALSGPLTVSAQDTEPSSPEAFIVNNAWADPNECNIGNARPVVFSYLASGAKELDGVCVSVEGYWHGRALFGYEAHAMKRLSNTSERLRGKRIGLYAEWERVGEPPEETIQKTIVGIVGRCETQWPGAMMVMGYCHYSGGPILLVSQVHSSRPD